MSTDHHPIPLSLYCHLPWCIQKCPYCDFNSYTHRPNDQFTSYTEALCHDLIASAPLAKNRPLQSIFFGGGTPSLFAPEYFERFLQTIYDYYPVDKYCEITMEINPHTYERGWLDGYRKLGINRASVGAQSFSTSLLSALGRTHSPDNIFQTYETLQLSGFDNINIDIMYGLPKQSVLEGLDDLRQAIALQPQHLSWYELTIEPNTLFYKNRPQTPGQDTLYTLFCHGRDILAKHGYDGYEVSAYASNPTNRSRHNLNYWQFGDYIGCGAGAHGKITNLSPLTVMRSSKHKSPKAYQLAPTATPFSRTVDPEDLIFEYMLNYLRLTQPLSLRDFSIRTGLDRTSLSPYLDRASQENFLRVHGDTVQLTQHGRRYLNNVQELFLKNQ